jgi:hypothetical protein
VVLTNEGLTLDEACLGTKLQFAVAPALFSSGLIPSLFLRGKKIINLLEVPLQGKTLKIYVVIRGGGNA